MMSGVGVRIAASTKLISTTHFSKLNICFPVSLLMLLMNNIMRGSWKTSAKPRRYLVTKLKYCLVEIILVTPPPSNLFKKYKAAGREIKYAKSAPVRLKSVEDAKTTYSDFLGWSGSVGLINERIWNTSKGKDMRNPKKMDIEIVKLKPPAGEE